MELRRETEQRLLKAGFASAHCWLAPRELLSTIVLGPHVRRLPVREPFLDEVLARLGEPVVVDCVRLDAIA